MNEPLAYLITWTTHGTWLHGDARGSIQRGRPGVGAEILTSRPNLAAFERGEAGTPLVLDDRRRECVSTAIRQHIAFRGWEAHAINVRTNHVHVIVANCGLAPERIMNEFKSYATRALRAARLVARDAPVWTRHGSTRYMWDERSVAMAVAYVTEGQDVPR